MEGGDKSAQNASINLSRPIRCIVKLGGAAITCKNELETINEGNLKEVSAQLRQSMIMESSSGKVLGMDWSKRTGEADISCAVDCFRDQPSLDSSPFIVVHGAGSFGHFQASKSSVHKGGLAEPLVKAGFVATRISVTMLNLEIVRALAKDHKLCFARKEARVIFLCCLLTLSWSSLSFADKIEVTIREETSIAKTDDSSVCATLDWWPNQKCDYNDCGHGTMSVSFYWF